MICEKQTYGNFDIILIFLQEIFHSDVKKKKSKVNINEVYVMLVDSMKSFSVFLL